MAANHEGRQRKASRPGATRRRVLAGVLGTALAGLSPRQLAAEGELTTSGNADVATANASGGALVVGDIDSGGNVGNAIAIGDTSGAVSVNGGDVANATTLAGEAGGGTAIATADASGGSS